MNTKGFQIGAITIAGMMTLLAPAGAQGPGEGEQDLVAAAPPVGRASVGRAPVGRAPVGRACRDHAHVRSSWSSACLTRSESSRYFTRAPSVAAADPRSSSAVPR